MGFIEKIIQKTLFFPYYQKRKIKKETAIQNRIEEELKPLRLKFYQEIVKPGDLVFDIGANIGNRIHSFLECGAKVIAIEPQPPCLDILNQKFRNSIIIEPIGLGEKDGELDMFIATDSTVSSFSQEFINKTKERFKTTKWNHTIKVPVKTLDSLIHKYGTPNFCKIDVEGFEIQVLSGLHRPLPLLSLEYCVPEMTNSLKECINYLHQLSPNGLFNYSIGESMNWASKEWFDTESFKKHVTTKEFESTLFGDIYFKNQES